MEVVEGRVLRVFPRDTNTDEIISGKYKYDELDLKKLAVHTFEAIDPEFHRDAMKTKDPIVVAGENFGAGSSREQAPQVLKACGVACVIASSFARIFYRNAFNIGLPLVECAGIEVKAAPGDSLKVDFKHGTIENVTKGESYAFKEIPPFMRRLLDAGGLTEFLQEGGYEEMSE